MSGWRARVSWHLQDLVSDPFCVCSSSLATLRRFGSVPTMSTLLTLPCCSLHRTSSPRTLSVYTSSTCTLSVYTSSPCTLSVYTSSPCTISVYTSSPCTLTKCLHLILLHPITLHLNCYGAHCANAPNALRAHSMYLREVSRRQAP